MWPPPYSTGIRGERLWLLCQTALREMYWGYVNVDVYRTPSPNFCLKYVYTFLVSHIWIVPASIRLYLNLEA
jgi:hypothetical protein